MPVPDLSFNLQHGPTGHILSAMSHAESLFGRRRIDFPRIAVIGDETAGKSSLLESICQIPFPRGNHTTTRCPTLLRLQRNPHARWGATVWTTAQDGTRRSETRVDRAEKLTEVIRELGKEVVDGRGFAEEGVTVLVEGGRVELTLVDLPGYFGIEGLREGGKEVRVVRDLLLGVMADENTVVVVVVQANQLVKTVNVFQLVKEYEKGLDEEGKKRFRERVVFCFTKCDLVAGVPGREGGVSFDIEEILENQGKFAVKPHGWFAVVNNGAAVGEGIGFEERLERDRVFEEGFFERTHPYNMPQLRKRCGTNNLLRKLSSLLAEKICERAPRMLQQTERALGMARRELAKLGVGAGRDGDRDVVMECRMVVNDIKHYYVQATEGVYGDLEDEVEDLMEEVSKEDIEKCQLAYYKNLRSRRFAKEIKEARLPVDDEKYLERLRERVERAVNGKFDYTMPIPEVVFQEVRKCAKTWRNLAHALCNDIADAALDCLKLLVRVKASKYSQLPHWLNEHFKRMIHEQRTKALIRLDWHYVDETLRPDTLNEQFRRDVDALRQIPGLGRNVDENRDAYVASLRAYLPIAEARFVDNAVRTVTTHIMDVPVDKRRCRVESDVMPKYTFATLDVAAVMEGKGLMGIREELEREREEQTEKVEVLEKLRDALRDIPFARKGRKETEEETGNVKEQEQVKSGNGTVEGGWEERRDSWDSGMTPEGVGRMSVQDLQVGITEGETEETGGDAFAGGKGRQMPVRPNSVPSGRWRFRPPPEVAGASR